MIEFDQYQYVAMESRASMKEQRSEFIGIAIPVTSQDDFAAGLTRIQKEFFDATHHCWAWRMIAGGDVRAHGSDAGEPSGTAGKPILQAIESAGLYDTAVVVVRYYGGVKLGTGGLARAYRDAARAVLEPAPQATRILYSRIRIEAPFSTMGSVYRLITPPDIVLVEETFGEPNVFVLNVRSSLRDRVLAELSEKRIAASAE